MFYFRQKCRNIKITPILHRFFSSLLGKNPSEYHVPFCDNMDVFFCISKIISSPPLMNKKTLKEPPLKNPPYFWMKNLIFLRNQIGAHILKFYQKSHCVNDFHPMYMIFVSFFQKICDLPNVTVFESILKLFHGIQN